MNIRITFKSTFDSRIETWNQSFMQSTNVSKNFLSTEEQSRIQSPQACWSADGRRERDWSNGKIYCFWLVVHCNKTKKRKLQDSCGNNSSTRESLLATIRWPRSLRNNISKGPQTKMMHVYVGSSKPDLISQRNTQMTNIAARLIWLRRKIWLCKTSTRH